MKSVPRKIIYFDRETIKNILQEKNKGTQVKTSGTSRQASSSIAADAEASSNVYLGVPILARIKFVFTGTLQMRFLLKYDSTTTITSTEISDFESIQNEFTRFEDKQVYDVENSSTFFRVAGGYLKMLGNNVEGVNVKEFKSVMDSFEGYDVYKIDDLTYIRFNNSAFVSNYKRNDLLTTRITAYCVFVGLFIVDDFNFLKQLTKMQEMLTSVNTSKTIADVYPAELSHGTTTIPKEHNITNNKTISLYDVVYASIAENKVNNK